MTHVALIGAGLMGAGLARVFGGAGCEVSAFDLDRAALERLEGARPAASLADAAAGADLVIEAVSERLAVKRAVFAELADATGPHTLLATNSSVIAVGEVAAELPDAAAARTLGTHFWNPPDVIPLVEVIPGPRTADAAMERAMALLTAAGKEPVRVRADMVPGNRLQHALWREALALVEEGVCSPAEVDHIVKRSFGLRLPVLGPCENADLVGLDLTREIHSVVLPTLSRATTPSPALSDRLDRGEAGVKSGSGLYPQWTPEAVDGVRSRLAEHLKTLLASPARTPDA